MKCLQINIERSKAAHDLLLSTTKQEKIDLVIISEPNIILANKYGYIMDNENKVAVRIVNKNLGIIIHETADGYIKLQFEKFHIYGCYSSPNIPIAQFQEFIDDLMNDVKNSREAIIAGDLNAKSPLWGSPATDPRGIHIEDWAAEINLQCMNTGEPTFVRGASKTHIDVTFATNKTAAKVKPWKVLDIEVNTYHKYIAFEITNKEQRPPKRNKTKRLNTNMLTKNVENQLKFRYDTTTELIRALEDVTKKSLEIKTAEAKNEAYWWTDQISEPRKVAIRARRTFTRLRSRLQAEDPEVTGAHEHFVACQEVLNKTINIEKKKAWKTICEDIEEDIWGQGYQIATRFSRRQIPPLQPYKDTESQMVQGTVPGYTKKRI